MNCLPYPSVVVIQHSVVEGPGRIDTELQAADLGVQVVPPDVALPPDVCRTAAGLVMLGGPMSVYEADRYPRLRAEMCLLEQALKAELPVLGICLGSQLLAAVLGAHVRPGVSKEIGWHEVSVTDEANDDPLFRALPARFRALHWHGDIFDLPDGACRLARSAMTECQAYRYGPSAWGILFHLEAVLNQVHEMATAFPDDVVAGETTADRLIEDSEREDHGAVRLASLVFGQWAGVVRTHRGG